MKLLITNHSTKLEYYEIEKLQLFQLESIKNIEISTKIFYKAITARNNIFFIEVTRQDMIG